VKARDTHRFPAVHPAREPLAPAGPTRSGPNRHYLAGPRRPWL